MQGGRGLDINKKHVRSAVRNLTLVSVEKFPEYSGESEKKKEKVGKLEKGDWFKLIPRFSLILGALDARSKMAFLKDPLNHDFRLQRRAKLENGKINCFFLFLNTTFTLPHC